MCVYRLRERNVRCDEAEQDYANYAYVICRPLSRLEISRANGCNYLRIQIDTERDRETSIFNVCSVNYIAIAITCLPGIMNVLLHSEQKFQAYLCVFWYWDVKIKNLVFVLLNAN